MKLAVIGSRGYPSTYGGFETFVRHLAPYLHENGHTVTVYGRGGANRITTTTLGGVHVVRTPGIDTTSLSTLTHGFSSVLHASRAHYDAALIVNIANSYFLPLLRHRGIPSLLNVDGLEWERAKWGRVARSVFYRAARLGARHADELVADSAAIASIWSREFGRRPLMIPYGADIHTQAADVRVPGAEHLAPGTYVLVVARLVPENNVRLTLEALDRTSPRPPLVIVGDGPQPKRTGRSGADQPNVVARNRAPTLATTVPAQIARSATRSDVTWLGHVADQAVLRTLWRNCGVYVHGHSVGGTNPALLQALAAGAPTLALDTPFNREVIGAHSGSLFQHDPDILAAAISTALGTQPGVMPLSGAEAQAIIAERYSWSEVCAAYARALSDLATLRTTRPTVAP